MSSEYGKSLIVPGGALNPSNRSDPNADYRDRTFENLAYRYDRDNPTDADREMFVSIDAKIKQELLDAGINFQSLEAFRGSRGEVPTSVIGYLGPWSFRRAWYYYVAEGSGIPPEFAQKLHEKQGHACRVEGHCGAPSPIEYNKGFGVGCYHVDTPNALTALADTINEVLDQHNPVVKYAIRLVDTFEDDDLAGRLFRAHVIKEIEGKSIGSVQSDPEGNPVTFWVKGRVKIEDIQKIDGVEDVIAAQE